MEKAKKIIACIGNVTQDFLFWVNDIPAIDDVAMIQKSLECLGGRGALVALILGRLGINIRLITVLPQSEKSTEYIEFLKLNNVDTDYICIDKNCSSLFKVYAYITSKHNNCISFFQPSSVDFNLNEKIAISAIHKVDIAYFTTHKKSFNIALLNSIDMINTHVIHNVSSYFLLSDEYMNVLLNKSHTLIMNEREISDLLAKLNINTPYSLFDIASNLKEIYVTHGGKGSVLYKRNGEVIKHEVKEIETSAPLGAGDAYAAGVIFGIANNFDSKRILDIASKFASLSIKSNTSYPDLDKIALV